MKTFSVNFSNYSDYKIYSLPEGGWLVTHKLGHNYRVFVDRDPILYHGYASAYDITKISIREYGTHKVMYCSEHNGIFCAPHPEFCSQIIQPSWSQSENKILRFLLNLDEGEYNLIVAKKGGERIIFKLPSDSKAESMVSCDGQTILVVQHNLFTIFDNPLF